MVSFAACLKTHLQGDQGEVDLVVLHELLVGSALNCLAVLDADDDVSVTYGREAMGDDDGGAALTCLHACASKVVCGW